MGRCRLAAAAPAMLASPGDCGGGVLPASVATSVLSFRRLFGGSTLSPTGLILMAFVISELLLGGSGVGVWVKSYVRCEVECKFKAVGVR